MKADLHMHGPIAFTPYWLEAQKYYEKNLTKEIVDTAIEKGIGLTAITSEFDEIPKNSIHDRFKYMMREAVYLNLEYKIHKIGEKDMAFIVERQRDGST